MENSSNPIHPWRLCPYGHHWVREHRRKTKTKTTVVSAHCAKNPSGKDHLYPDEIQKVAELNMKDVKKFPCPDYLVFQKQWRKKYDDYIALWTKYWNDIFEFQDPIDVNLIKALVATESEFKPKAKNHLFGKIYARGLMQVTDSSNAILKNYKGELRDHYVNLTQDELYNPNLNICAGIRWLIQKRKLASSKLKREATWYEAVAEYKSYAKDWKENPQHDQKLRFDRFLEQLTKCENFKK